MKTTQIALEADKDYGGFCFTKEAIERVFDSTKRIPITFRFDSNNIVGWGTMISCDDGKLKIEMELSPAGEALIRSCWELRSGGKTKFKTTNHLARHDFFILDTFALVPPDLPLCPKCSKAYGTPTGLTMDTMPPINMMECKNCRHVWGELARE
ncbi:MAG: hypothetical protein ACTSW7_01460 [Candidatus Thorarchaeota archaeon]|nr:hypothetical protein [Thermoplasmatales archaeon]